MPFEGVFSFNEFDSSEFGVWAYEIGNEVQGNVPFTSTGTAIKEKPQGLYRSNYYGRTYDNDLTFQFSFGKGNNCKGEKFEPLTIPEKSAITSWLTGASGRRSDYQGYFPLWIDLPYYADFRYNCRISRLQTITYGMEDWGMTATVECDSPFAYFLPSRETYDVLGLPLSFIFHNRCMVDPFYYPKLIITLRSGDRFSIKNATDNDREMVFDNLVYTAPLTITIDNERKIITNNQGLNLFDNFNLTFFRVVRGYNELIVHGDCIVNIDSEFPVDVGG